MQLKVLLSFFHRPEDRFDKASHPCCPVFLALLEEAEQVKEFAASDILEALEEYLLKPCLVKAFFPRQDGCSQPTIGQLHDDDI